MWNDFSSFSLVLRSSVIFKSYQIALMTCDKNFFSYSWQWVIFKWKRRFLNNKWCSYHVSFSLNIHFYNSIDWDFGHARVKVYVWWQWWWTWWGGKWKIEKIYLSYFHFHFSIYDTFEGYFRFIYQKKMYEVNWGTQPHKECKKWMVESHKIHFYHLLLIIISIFYSTHGGEYSRGNYKDKCE